MTGDIYLSTSTLFQGLASAPAVLLAVSGGPDSMALMLLVARWGAALNRAPAIHVATVDHGLRRGSAAEAALVADVAGRLGLPHATLAWTGEKPTTRIQERARAARYALLSVHAKEVGATHVLTAHHADDQAETVLMRLARGSGIAGLAGMRRETALAPGVTLARPLLDVPKAALVALCEAEGLACVDDPSNRDTAYARARLRAEAARLAALGLDRAALTRLARRAERADAALEAEAARVEATSSSSAPPIHLSRHDGGIEPEILLRLLRRAIERAMPGATLRLDRLESLTEAVAAALRDGRPHRATLGGARIVLGADATLAVAAAPARRRGVIRG